MKKTKILGAVISTAAAMTDLCAEISHNFIADSQTEPVGKSKDRSKMKNNKNNEG